MRLFKQKFRFLSRSLRKLFLKARRGFLSVFKPAHKWACLARAVRVGRRQRLPVCPSSPGRGCRRNPRRNWPVRGNRSSNREGVGSISISPERKATAWARPCTAMTSMPSTTAASAAISAGTISPRRFLSSAAAPIPNPPRQTAAKRQPLDHGRKGVTMEKVSKTQGPCPEAVNRRIVGSCGGANCP